MKIFKKDKHNVPSRQIVCRKAYVGCIFKRFSTSTEWEHGLAIVHPHNVGVSDIEGIIDLDNKLVKKVWNYELNKTSTIVDNHLVI